MESTFVLFIVEIQSEKLKVQLYFLEGKIKLEDEGKWRYLYSIERMTELSGIILTLLKRAYDISGKEFNEENVTGESKS